MFKKILLAFAMMFVMLGSALAAVDLNTADQAALDSVKGVGAVKSKAILDERSKGGPFKDWADFEKRVHGFGAKTTDAMSKNGVTVNGQAKADAKKASAASSASASASSVSASASAPASASAKAASAPAPVSASAKAASAPAPVATSAKSASAAASASASAKK